MYVKAKVDECDFTDKKYDTPVEGAWAIAQGASGRFCCVMFMGPEYLEEHNIETISYDEAVAKVEAIDGAWVEF